MQQIKLPASESSQYLGFTVGGEEYGVDILRVREIREWQRVRALPELPEHIIGVLDLRGTLVPIVDLRKRFRQGNVDYGSTTVVIVVSVETGARRLIFGIVVDGVSEVLDINTSDIRPTPDLGDEINTRYISGMVAVQEQMVILLNVDRMLSPDELAML